MKNLERIFGLLAFIFMMKAVIDIVMRGEYDVLDSFILAILLAVFFQMIKAANDSKARNKYMEGNKED